MTLLLWGLLAGVGAGGVLYQWLGLRWAARWLAEPVVTSAELPAVTLLRPVKAGVPRLKEKLLELSRALLPGDQLVLGAAANSAELAICQAVQAAEPARDIVVVECMEGVALNPKVSKLIQMTPATRHEAWILSDSEAVIDGKWLGALRAEWQAHAGKVLTTAYRFVGAHSWPQRLDAVAILLGLWPGLAVVRRWGRVDFTLGAATALQRRDVEAVGGWEALGSFLAEDRELGRALVKQGREVRLARTITTLDVDSLGWRAWWRHQCRVAATYRAVAPAGFAGTLATHSSSAMVLLALLPGAAWLWRIGVAAAVLGIRGVLVGRLARLVGCGRPDWLLPSVAAGWMETVGWARSWVLRTVWWSGRWWRIGAKGELLDGGNPPRR